MADIVIHHLHLNIMGKEILNISNQKIPCNTITGIIGHNGSGKTSLLKTLAGLFPASQANITLPYQSMVMVLHHTPFIRMSVIDNLRLLKKTYPMITEDKISKVIEHFALGDLQQQPATKLSAGEKQRLSIARAYLIDAELICLDEPTSNLDPKSTLMIEEKIKELNQQGIGFIICSHDFAQVKRLCTDVVLMDNGHIVEMGPTAEFFQHPQTLQAKLFLDFHGTKVEQ
jgi:tungstate transport system ATP-binding protein